SSGTVNADVEFTLVGPDLEELTKYSAAIIKELRTGHGLADVDTTMALRKPELRVEVDRERAQDQGVSVQTIASTLRTLVGGAIDDFMKSFNKLNPPADYQLIASGRAKTQTESNAAFFMALILSLLFMYMILAAQFESFVHPITILLAVPLTIPFALLSLLFLSQPLTIYSILGVFLLFGIVKKNGILQVDYTNILRARGGADPALVPSAYRDGTAAAENAADGRALVPNPASDGYHAETPGQYDGNGA